MLARASADKKGFEYSFNVLPHLFKWIEKRKFKCICFGICDKKNTSYSKKRSWNGHVRLLYYYKKRKIRAKPSFIFQKIDLLIEHITPFYIRDNKTPNKYLMLL